MGLPDMDLSSLRQAYAAGTKPSDIIEQLYPLLAATKAVFIKLAPLEQLQQRCAELEQQEAGSRGPLWGVPFAVKDNVDVAGYPTTAACPAFEYNATRTAPAIAALIDAGCIMVGKTNMDQFASGLNGTRSPFGCPANAFDYRFVPGGSSSGSGAIVGMGHVTFSIGTDTAGSGRVPAGLNGCVGVKPTVGSISTVGVVPACASLDCLSVFAHNVTDGAEVAKIMRHGSAGAKDVWRRPPAAVSPPEAGFRFAVPTGEFLDWSSPGGAPMTEASQQQFAAAIERLKQCGGQQVDIDFSPFATTARLLYEASFVSERFAGIRDFLVKANGHAPSAAEALQLQAAVNEDKRVLPVIRAIISGAAKFTAADVFGDMARLAELRASALPELAKIDMLLVPTAISHYTQAELLAEEGASPPRWPKNAALGRFTNFVNLLDMCALSVPSGTITINAEATAQDSSEEVAARLQHLRSTGPAKVVLPFGVTLIGKAWHDEFLWRVGAAMQQAAGLGCGPKGHGVSPVLRPVTETNGAH